MLKLIAIENHLVLLKFVCQINCLKKNPFLFLVDIASNTKNAINLVSNTNISIFEPFECNISKISNDLNSKSFFRQKVFIYQVTTYISGESELV